MGIENYQLCEKFGEGTYGSVYKAIHLPTQTNVAIKKVNNVAKEDDLPVEVKYLELLKDSKNIVKMREYFYTSPNELCIVMELIETDLWKIMSNPSLLTFGKIKHYIKQLLESLYQCHSKGIMHRDIKPANLLINYQDGLKLTDFGLSTSFLQLCELSNNVVSLYYRPPELLLGSIMYGPEIDIWSVGCILMEMVINNYLFAGADESQQLDLIFKMLGVPSEREWPGIELLPKWKTTHYYQQMEIVKQWNHKNLISSMHAPSSLKPLSDSFKELNLYIPKLIDLTSKMLSMDPKKRITSWDALHHPFLSQPSNDYEAMIDNLIPNNPNFIEQLKYHYTQFQHKQQQELQRQQQNQIFSSNYNLLYFFRPIQPMAVQPPQNNLINLQQHTDQGMFSQQNPQIPQNQPPILDFQSYGYSSSTPRFLPNKQPQQQHLPIYSTTCPQIVYQQSQQILPPPQQPTYWAPSNQYTTPAQTNLYIPTQQASSYDNSPPFYSKFSYQTQQQQQIQQLQQQHFLHSQQHQQHQHQPSHSININPIHPPNSIPPNDHSLFFEYDSSEDEDEEEDESDMEPYNQQYPHIIQFDQESYEDNLNDYEELGNDEEDVGNDQLDVDDNYSTTPSSPYYNDTQYPYSSFYYLDNNGNLYCPQNNNFNQNQNRYFMNPNHQVNSTNHNFSHNTAEFSSNNQQYHIYMNNNNNLYNNNNGYHHNSINNINNYNYNNVNNSNHINNQTTNNYSWLHKSQPSYNPITI